MKPQQLYEYAKMAKACGTPLSLVGRMPKGFPRAIELLCQGPNGPVRSYDHDKVILWLVKNNLVETTPPDGQEEK